MRKFISIVTENNIQAHRETPVGKLATKERTADTFARGAVDIAHSPIGQEMTAAGPNILRDLETLRVQHQDLARHDDSVIDGAAGATTGYVDAEPRTPENLPAIISRELVTNDDFDPHWHQVRNLPGMMQQAIRMVGRLVFGQVTTTRLEDIQMLTTAFNMNDEVDVRKMFSLIHQHGHKLEDMNFDFSESMPSYAALAGETTAQVWRAAGYEFLLMKDNGGYYVYGWPETQSKLSQPGNAPMLDHNT